MQDLVGGDNNRTPVIFQGSYIYRINALPSRLSRAAETINMPVFYQVYNEVIPLWS